MPGAKCFGCSFSLMTAYKLDIPIRMGSHVSNCEEAKDMLSKAFNESTSGFKFKGYSFFFKYTPGSRLVYIFTSKEAAFAMSALPLAADDEPTLENAQRRANEYLHHWVEDLGFLSPDEYMAHRSTKLVYRKTTPKKRKPEGPHCEKCWKLDEGDLVDNPLGEGKLCMVHFIEAMK